MIEKKQYEQHVKELSAEIELIVEQHGADCIEQTASRLEKLQYAPPVPVTVAVFLRLDKTSLQAEVQKIIDAVERGEEKTGPVLERCIQSIRVLLYYYRKLQLLRDDDPESWDEIDELYVHD